MANSSAMRVIGPPRSGTNLAKFLVEVNTPIKCHFDSGWWKHALISPQPSGRLPTSPELPTVIMFREPVAQLVALFRLSQRKARSIQGEGSLEEFIASPIVIAHPDRLISYRFPSPIEYLLQYYHAALNWAFPGKAFVELTDLQGNPQTLSAFLSYCFGEYGRSPLSTLPAGYLGRNPDTDFSKGVRYEEGTTLGEEETASLRMRRELAPSILTHIDLSGLGRLHAQLRLNRLQPPPPER